MRSPQHTTLFNTQRVETEEYAEEAGLLVDTYAQSVLMSTYLVAFVVCDYANITATSKGDVKVGE